MNFKDLRLAINLALDAGLVPMLSGAPGIGKSDLGRAVMGERGLTLMIDLRASQLEPTDLVGIPEVVDGQTRWTRPAWFPEPGSKGVLFLDEITDAPRGVEAGLSQLVLDRVVAGGAYKLPDGWIIIAAGNRRKDRASAGSMSTALANRLVHFNVEGDNDGWKSLAFERGYPVQLVAFIGVRPALLNDFNPDRPVNPTSRSWSSVGEVLKAPGAIVDGSLSDAARTVVGGLVGEPAMAEFSAFMETMKRLSTLDEIIKDPAGVEVPNDNDSRYALCSMIAFSAKPETAKPLIAFLMRMPQDYRAAAAEMIRRDNPTVAETGAFAVLLSKL